MSQPTPFDPIRYAQELTSWASAAARSASQDVDDPTLDDSIRLMAAELVGVCRQIRRVLCEVPAVLELGERIAVPPTPTPEAALAAWNARNNEGLGWPAGEPWHSVNELGAELGILLMAAESTSAVAVYLTSARELVAVGDSHGPWAVCL